MNVIVVLKKVAGSSAGIVFRRLLEGLEQRQELNILRVFSSSLIENSPIENTSFDCSPDAGSISYKLGLILFNREQGGSVFSDAIIQNLDREKLVSQIDGVLCLASGGSFEELAAAYSISKTFHLPYHIHTIDAIPPPPWWGEKRILNGAKRRYVRKFFAKANSFSAISKKMADYQSNLAGRESKTRHPVISNPVGTQFVRKHFEEKTKRSFVKLLYLGKFNKTRNGLHLVEALKDLNQNNVKAILQIVGLSKTKFLSNLSLDNVPKHVELLPWTKKPENYIATADILVDVDIADSRDVFISGKLLTYLCSNIPILSITTASSPSSELLASQLYGTEIVPHSSSRIAEAIQSLMTIEDYDRIEVERKKTIATLSKSMVSSKLVENLLNICPH